MSQQECLESAVVTTPSTPQEETTIISGPPPKIQMKLHILQIIKQKQNENGLKHLDFESYRRYCTKRLRKLRSLLDMKHKKDSKFTQVIKKKKKKNVKATTGTTHSDHHQQHVENIQTATTPTDSSPVVVDGIKNSNIYGQKKVTDKIVKRYTEQKAIQSKKLREQVVRILTRENVEKQIHEQKEKLLASFVKKKKKESKNSKNIQYDHGFLTELYTHINASPVITDEEVDERVKKILSESPSSILTDSADLVRGDERFLHLLLVQAERAWSHSRHLKNEMKQFSDNSRIKFHQLNRLKKAVKWSKLLLDFCNLYSDDQRTILEAEAYYSYLLGLLLLEKGEWAESLKLFKQSQTVYDQLYKVLTSIPQQVREEYKKQVNEITVNYVRWCEYHLKKVEGGEVLLQQLENSQQIDTIQLKLSQVKDDEDKNSPQTVEWEGVMTIPIPNEKLRVNLANGRAFLDAEYKTVESKLRAFEKLFGIYNDSMRMIREEMKLVSATSNVQRKESTSSGVSQVEQLNQLRFLHSYISYILGTKTIERNIMMLQSLLDRLDTIQQQVQKERVDKKQKTNPVDIIRLFDGLLQNVNDLTDMLQSVNINEESAKKLQSDLQVKKKTFTAYRCYYMAYAYASQHKWAECFVLLERSENLLTNVGTETFGLPSPKDILSEIRKAKITAKSQQVLSKKSSNTKSVLSAYDSDDEKDKTKKQEELIKLISEKPVTARLSQFIPPTKAVVDNLESYNIVELPPNYQLIPGKPVFFDIANGLVSDYPVDYIDTQINELSKHVEKPKDETNTEEPKKKGWFGLW